MQRLTIDTDYLADQLKQLLHIPSPTGFTDNVVRHVCEELGRIGLDYDMTRRGAIRARMRGRADRPARAIVSHVDTLGAQVKLLKDNGRLELVAIGHWSARFAEGARATVFTERGAYRGSILPLKASGHTYNEEIDAAPVGWRHVEMRIDAWSYGKADLERLGFAVGDIVAVDPQPEFLENGYVVSRHLDNKAGVALMLAAARAMAAEGTTPPADVYWLFTIAEEVGYGASSVLSPEVASMVAVDNGTVAPGQNSEEFGVTIAMADQTGPFDYHLTRRLAQFCEQYDIRYCKDVFRYYRSDSASAIEGGADVRTALVTFGVDASHGYERTHMHALRSLAELMTVWATSPVQFTREAEEHAGLTGFPRQPTEDADPSLPEEAPEPHE